VVEELLSSQEGLSSVELHNDDDDHFFQGCDVIYSDKHTPSLSIF
jgi:hypothetical protein